MSKTSEQSIASKMIRLFTEFPCAGTNDGGFEIEMPLKLSEACYKVIVNHIEFRRRCMNQGFDNLLELLAMHHDVLQQVDDVMGQPDDKTAVTTGETQ